METAFGGNPCHLPVAHVIQINALRHDAGIFRPIKTLKNDDRSLSIIPHQSHQ